MSRKLVEAVVRALVPPPSPDGKSVNRITYDSEVPGFGARITSAGAVGFVLNYRRKSDGLERRATIGSWPAWSVAAARERAKSLKRIVDSGGDPVGDSRALRDAPTVAEMCRRFEEEHLPKKRPTTQADYRGIIREIEAELGGKKVAGIEFADVDRLHRRLSRRAPYRANRVLAVACKMFNLAILWGWRPDNPTRGVERNQEDKRERPLTPDELIRLTEALDRYPDQQTADIFRLALLTGCRISEATSAEWTALDPDTAFATWRKKATNTKQKKDHSVPLSAPARELLMRLHEQQRDALRVFPGANRRTVERPFRQICAAAGIAGLRIHDLRHCYATTLASSGTSLVIIGKLLGHTRADTTLRYAHVHDDALSRATETAGAILSGKEPAPVVPLRGRR
jgi:integrase